METSCLYKQLVSLFLFISKTKASHDCEAFCI